VIDELKGVNAKAQETELAELEDKRGDLDQWTDKTQTMLDNLANDMQIIKDRIVKRKEEYGDLKNEQQAYIDCVVKFDSEKLKTLFTNDLDVIDCDLEKAKKRFEGQNEALVALLN